MLRWKKSDSVTSWNLIFEKEEIQLTFVVKDNSNWKAQSSDTFKQEICPEGNHHAPRRGVAYPLGFDFCPYLVDGQQEGWHLWVGGGGVKTKGLIPCETTGGTFFKGRSKNLSVLLPKKDCKEFLNFSTCMCRFKIAFWKIHTTTTTTQQQCSWLQKIL